MGLRWWRVKWVPVECMLSLKGVHNDAATKLQTNGGVDLAEDI